MAFRYDLDKEFLYPDEPARFDKNTLEPFVQWAVKMDTSDITIQNEDNIFCEIHGRMRRVTKRALSRNEVIDLISAIYKGDGAVSTLNGGDDVDIAWSFTVGRGERLRFRVNCTTVLADGAIGYQITIRVIKNEPQKLEDLGLPKELVDNICPKTGLVLIVGATGSGKSTLLAAVLAWKMRDPDANVKILTYEAPIEFVYDSVYKPTVSVAQTEIGAHLKSFEHGVRNALRRKPSIILMGEMRDRETIGEGLVASMTGHLVYGTLHANTVYDVIPRMVNVFDPGEKNAKVNDILSSIKMIVAQMLPRSTNGGRVAIREYLVFTQEIIEQLQKADIDNMAYEVKQVLKTQGQTFADDAMIKFNNGLIDEKTLKDITRVSTVTDKDLEALSQNIYRGDKKE